MQYMNDASQHLQKPEIQAAKLQTYWNFHMASNNKGKAIAESPSSMKGNSNEKPLAFLKDITPDNLDNVLHLRIFRLWSPPNYYNPLRRNSIEMVFVDEEDTTIGGYVKKDLMETFRNVLSEGIDVYISNYQLGQNPGLYRYSEDPF